MNGPSWDSIAVWAQAISSTVVLILIYQQIKQANTQIVQNDKHELYRRSWEFVRFYQEELRPDEMALLPLGDWDPASDTTSPNFAGYVKHFYQPRVKMFALLNQLVEHQQVDEQLLFGYLEEDFNRFIELGVKQFGADEFRRTAAIKLKLLLTLWGSHVRASRLIFGTTGQYAKPTSA